MQVMNANMQRIMPAQRHGAARPPLLLRPRPIAGRGAQTQFHRDLTRLRIDTANLHRFRHTTDAEHIGSDAHRHISIEVNLEYIAE